MMRRYNLDRHAAVVLLLLAGLLPTRGANPRSDRCDWQWKFYQDSWLRSSSGRAVSTVETWYGLEDFEIQTTPGGTAHSVLDGYTFGTSSTAGVPVFAPTVAALRSVLAYVCSKKGAELREDRNVAEIPLQSLQQGRLRRGSELYTGDGEEIEGLLGSIQGASELRRFELLQYAPYYSLVWTLRDYADRLSLATQSVQGLGRLTGSVAKIMRKLASFLKVPERELSDFAELVERNCKLYGDSGSRVGAVVRAIERAFPYFQYSQYAVYGFNYVVAPLVRTLGCWGANLDLQNADPTGANKQPNQVNWGIQPRPTRAGSSRAAAMRIIKRSTVNASVSNTTATQLFPYPMPGSLLAPAVSIFSQQSDTVMAGGALVGRRMLASLLGPAGLSDTYLLLDTDGQPVTDTTHGSGGLGNGTSHWDPPHLSRVLQQQRADILNFQPLEAVVVAYREVVGIVSFISLEVVAPLNTAFEALQFREMRDAILAVKKIFDDLSVLFEGILGPLKGTLKGIADIFSFVKCPDALSVVCNIEDLIEAGVSALTKALGLGTIDEWIQGLLTALNFPSFRIDLGPFSSLADRLVSGVFAEKLAQAEVELRKLARIFDFSTFDPLAQVFNNGIRTAITGVTAHYVSALDGSVTFNCDRDGRNAYPGVFTARRQVMDCEQDLGAYLRLPCPASAKSCTINYKEKYPLGGCTPSSIPDQVRNGLYELFSLPPQPKIWFEDVFSAVYYCIDVGADIKLLGELFTTEAQVQLNDNIGTWGDVTRQRKHSMVPKLVDVTAFVDVNNNLDCSGGGRQVYIEHVVVPAKFQSNVWEPCMTKWRSGDNADYRSDYCWDRWGGLVGRPLIGYDDDTWGYDQGGWQCSGDASGVFAQSTYNRATSSSGTETGARAWRYEPNLKACVDVLDRVSSGQNELCPANCICCNGCGGNCCAAFNCVDRTCTCKVGCSRPGSNTLKDWCNDNFGGLSTTGYADTSLSGLQQASRRAAKATRLAVLSSHDQAQSSAGTSCLSTINNCNGKGSCSLDGCIPDLLQYSCVTPFTNKLSENVVYVFGGSRRSQQGSFSCPQDYVAKLKRAEYGAGFTVTEVSAQLSMACFGRVCTFDITRITPYNIKNTLLAVVECVCGPGFDGKPSAAACVPCAAGSYRSATMDTCALCPAGTSSLQQAVSCSPCGLGEFGSDAGSQACTPCPDGAFANTTGSTACFTCPTNTVPKPDKSGCLVCPAGRFTDGPASLACLVSPSGFASDPPNRQDLAPCQPGSFASEGSSACQLCPAGTFSASPASAQCFPCDKGYYTSGTTGNLLCSSCPPGSSTAGAGSILADGAAVQSLCIGLPSAAQVQAVLTTSRATAAYSLASCTALLAEYGGVFEEVGNGLCNPGVHNTAVCNYDGGDCCRSTCVRNDVFNATFDLELEQLLAQAGLQSTEPLPELIKDYGCSFASFNCRDPVAAQASVAGGLANPAALTPEPLNITECPVAITHPNIGNGLCEELYNVEACSYDGGDCCPASCRFNANLRVAGSCSDSSFNCRDTRPAVDTVPPVLTGVPSDLTVTSTAGAPNFTFVTASDNDPAFRGGVSTTSDRVDHECAMPKAGQFLYKLLLTWSATDPAGNRSPVYRQTVTITDDERPSILRTPNNTRVACDRVPQQAVLTASDNDAVCFVPSSVQPQEARTNGNCPYNYTLTRTWQVSDAAGNSDNTTQVIQVYDTTPPTYPARDAVKGCLWPNNRRWYAFSDIAINSVFGFGTIVDACSSRNLTTRLVSCSTSLTLSRSTRKGIDTSNCQYNPTTRVLKLKALRPLDTTQRWIHNMVWRVADECGNTKDYVAGIVVGPSFSTDVYTEAFDPAQGILEVTRTSIGTSSTACLVADLAS